jgi:hypothetical protein
LPRFAGDEEQFPSLASGNPLDGGVQEGEFVLATDDPDPRTMAQPGGKRHTSRCRCVHPEWLPTDLEGLDRRRQALQLQFPERSKGVRAPATGVGSHQVRSQNLATFGLGAESGRLDDRVAEVVIGFPGCLAGAKPHPEPEGLLRTGVVPMDALLHAHRTSESCRGGREDDHQAVAQVLYFRAP